MVFNFFQTIANSISRIIRGKVAKYKKLRVEDLKSCYVIPRSKHDVSRNDFSDNAVKVLYRLKNRGFEAYLIGGCIRDVLLGIEPKDFDVVTNARPEEVRRLFSNCRIIGRRFPLVHICFRDEVIEVATFRSAPKLKNPNSFNVLNKFGGSNTSTHSSSGMLVKDNVYGNSIEEDAIRRDFTINAIYYSIHDFSLIDFFDGMQDIRKKELKLIGVPSERYIEDPVRMLRAIRFAAKLEFKLHSDTSAPIFDLYHLLSNIPAARLFDEYRKLFLTGSGYKAFSLLRQYNLFGMLFPATEACLKEVSSNIEQDYFYNFIKAVLTSTDARVLEAKTISPAFVLAVFLWQPLRIKAKELEDSGIPANAAFYDAIDIVLNDQRKIIAFPRLTTMMVKDIWILQERLKNRYGKRAIKTFTAAKFRAAYDFLLLRAEALEEGALALSEWWTQYISSNDKERFLMVKKISGRRGGKYNKKHNRNDNKSDNKNDIVTSENID